MDLRFTFLLLTLLVLMDLFLETGYCGDILS